MSDYPPSSFSFAVQFDGASAQSEASFQEVSGIESELDMEAIQEGGESRFVHSLPKGVKHPNLVLKRGIADRQSQLVRWCQTVLEGGLSQPVDSKDLTLCLLGESGAALRVWCFRSAYPTHWAVDPFAANKSTIAIEKIELSYSTLQRTR